MRNKLLELLKESKIIGFFTYESVFLYDFILCPKDYNMTKEELEVYKEEADYCGVMRQSINGSPWCKFRNVKTWTPETLDGGFKRKLDAMDNKVTLKCVTENGAIFYIQFYDGNIRIGLTIKKRTYPVDVFQIPMSDSTFNYYLNMKG